MEIRELIEYCTTMKLFRHNQITIIGLGVAPFTHCTGSTIHAGIGDTIINVCLAVGSSPSWYTCTTVVCNQIL